MRAGRAHHSHSGGAGFAVFRGNGGDLGCGAIGGQRAEVLRRCVIVGLAVLVELALRDQLLLAHRKRTQAPPASQQRLAE